MTAGYLATLAITAGWIVGGVIVGVLVLALLWGWRPAQRISFPFLDELVASSKVWGREIGNRDPPTTSQAIRQAGLAVAYALVTGFTISAVLDLIGQLATPAG